MNKSIVRGGLGRLKQGQNKLTRESLEKKYAKELAAARPDQRGEIYQRIMDEYDRQKNHKPSASSLW